MAAASPAQMGLEVSVTADRVVLFWRDGREGTRDLLLVVGGARLIKNEKDSRQNMGGYFGGRETAAERGGTKFFEILWRSLDDNEGN